MFSSFLIIFLGIINFELVYLSEIDSNMAWLVQKDLKDMNATCPPFDSCLEGRRLESLKAFSCQCSKACVQMDTCCADSTYSNFNIKSPKIKPTCRSINSEKAYYMVDSCPPSEKNDSVWENMCREEWTGHDSDVMKLVPVTSHYTLITYKNYFCFRCNENTDEFFYWNVKLATDDDIDSAIDNSQVTLNFDAEYHTWIAPVGVGGTMIPVQLELDIPDEIKPVPVACEEDVISQCSDAWEDKDVRDKCEFYMGIIHIIRSGYTFKYRNAHCALCNFEDLSNLDCGKFTVTGFGVKVPFSFTHLLDVNTSDGDKVGKIEKCPGDFLWDPYAKKCRKLTCALPGYVVTDGKCTPPS